MNLIAAAQSAAARARVGTAALVLPDDPGTAARLYIAGGGAHGVLAREISAQRSVRMSDLASLPWWHPDHQRLIWLTSRPRPVTLCPEGLQLAGGLPPHFQPTSAPIVQRRATWSFYARSSES